MKIAPTFTVVSVVSSCLNCPHRDSDRDGDSYCSIAGGDWITGQQVYNENCNGLTESCPSWEYTKELP